jgi:hypothetical protein
MIVAYGSLGDFPPHQEKRPLPRAKQSSYVGFLGLGRFQALEARLAPKSGRADRPVIWSPCSHELSFKLPCDSMDSSVLGE